MKLKNVKFKFTGGVDGGRGWKGDVKNMLLDTSKLKSLGWKPKHNSKQAITENSQTPNKLTNPLFNHSILLSTPIPKTSKLPPPRGAATYTKQWLLRECGSSY